MKTRALQHPYGQAIAFSPDGKLLACGGEDRSVHVYATETGEETLAYLGHSGPILSVAYSPDGKTIATGSADKTIRIWDAAGGQELRKLEGHSKEVLLVSYARDGRTLISADYEPAIRFWDAGSGAELRKLKPPGLQPSRFAFSPDGKKFLTVSHAVIRLHDLASGKELLPTSGHEREIQALQFSPNGRTLFSQSGDDSIRSWQVSTREETSRLLDHVSAGGSMALSADGRSLVVGTWNDIFLRDVSAGLPEKVDRFRIRAREKGSIRLAFAPDGKTFAWAVGYTMKKADYGVHLVGAQTGEEVRILKGHRGMVTAISFAADGKTVATASADFRGENSIRYWDLSTGEELRKFDVRPADSDGHYVRGYVAFSPDLGVLGSSDDRSLALRDGATGKEFARLSCEGGLILSAAVFSPDGRYLAVAESRAQTEPPPEVTLPDRIRLWEVATGTALATFVHGQGRVAALAFSPDGRTLVSGGSDTTILFWDLSGGGPKGHLPADLGRLWGDLADPDGRKAWQASFTLAAGGDSAVGFVAEHLRSARVEVSRVRQWITDLSSPSVAVQLKASKMLGQSLELEGTRAELEKALGAGPAEDLRARLEKLLSSAPDHPESRSPEDLRRGRALHLLEQMSTAEAKEALRALAAGEASRLSREAQAALVRIEARSEAK
jgi:WD40 repeat protein